MPFMVEFQKKRQFYNNLINTFDHFDRKNLLAEIITPPSFNEGMILFDILKGSNKAYLDDVNKYKRMHEDYREYIELWVHEIKTPIASSKLITQNNKNEVTDSLCEEIENIEEFVEQVLFYSRSNNVEKDYLLKKLDLHEVVISVIKKNSKQFIQNKVSVVTENLDQLVYCDSKWLEYMLSQIINNSIKYKSTNHSQICFNAKINTNNIELIISDNGIGIPDNELRRIFDKGFTGSNGRRGEKSTGMGLYICKKLCNKLGLNISASSQVYGGTIITISFPKNSMIDID